MSEGGGDSGMMMVVVLIIAVMCSCCVAAAGVGLVLYKNPNFLKDLLGDISASTPGAAPGPAPTPADCTTRAQTDCAGKRGKERDTCISSSKRACAATPPGTSTAAGGCGDATVEVFTDENYKGKSLKLKCGEYPNLKDYKDINDELSSMKIPSTLKVFSYDDANYKGRVGVWKNNISKIGEPLKDDISSLKIVPVGETNPPAIYGEWTGTTA